MKTVKITISGGFHNSNPVNIVIPDYAAENLKAGLETLQGVMTVGQRARMHRHFCGIAGCTCGSYHRANWEIASK